MDISSVSNMAHIRQEHESAKERENEMKIGKEKDENETAGNEVRRESIHGVCIEIKIGEIYE